MSARPRDDALGAARAAQVSWDDLRDRRTQRATWERFTRQSSRTDMRRVWLYGAALSGIGAVAIVGSVCWPRAPRPLPAVVSTPAVSEQRVNFDAGSLGIVSADAELETVTSSATRYEVAQRKGQVRYDIRHDPQREFVVRVADVTVTVLGTRFSVDLHDSLVRVRVERGRVRVFDGQRTTELVTGEAIEVRAFYAQEPDPEARLDARRGAATDMANERAASALAPSSKSPSVDELLTRADAARAAGRLSEAAELLRGVIARRPSAAQTSNAAFMLARVERGRGRHASAAQAFEQCAAFGGTLASEALAEAAASWLSAGEHSRARSAAQRYVQRYPHGPQVEKMRAIAE